MKHIVYRTENKLTGKFYYGVHNGTNPDYLGSGVVLKQAIKKHGKENFIRRTVFEGSETDCYDLEKLIVDQDLVNRNDCYNVTLGGGNPPTHYGNKFNVGRSPSSDNLDKMNKARRRTVINIETGEQYESVTAAALACGVKRHTMSRWLSGKLNNKTQLRYG